MKRQRLEKIDHLIQRELARIVGEVLKDPRLGFVTITRVDTTADLNYAKVYVGCIGDRHQVKQSLLALESAKRFLRGELGEAVDLRHTPELLFVEDRSAEKAIALTHLIDEVVNEERAQSGPSGPEAFKGSGSPSSGAARDE
ncbi:30S ribosome-binding factor RbfA [bacterium]|nr:MAG: 30S ribosome-binding factor RbfA [bacterium]